MQPFQPHSWVAATPALCVSTLFIAGLFTAPCALAQSLTTADDAAATALQTVVVSGSRTQTPLAQTPVAIGKVQRGTWEADKAKSVGEIINRIPGVTWNDLGNEQHSMGIRQPISTNAVYQYLEDGIPIRPLGVFNHNALNEINMNSAADVEVVKGAASSLYGSNAVGGAVNFLTQKPSTEATGMVGLRHDATDGFSRIDTGASHTWGDLGLRFSHYSSRRDRHNWQQYSRGAKDALSLRADYALGESAWVRAYLIHTDLETDMTGNLFENDYRTDPGKSINTFTWRKDRSTRAHLAWEGQTTANGLTTVTLFTRDNDHGQLPSYTITGCSGVICRGTINNNRVQSWGLDVKHVQEWPTWRTRLVGGLSMDRSQNQYVSDNLRITSDTATGIYQSYALNNADKPVGVRDYHVGIDNDALFAQLEFSPLEPLRLTLGGRFDTILYDFQNQLTPGASYGAANERRAFSRLSPKVGATWALSPTQSWYVNISQGFTPPEVSQLYSKTAIPDLKPSIYDNKEVGWRAQFFQSLMSDLALYQLDGQDTIVSYNLAPGNSENRNAGKTRSRGLEWALQQQFSQWDWRVGATWARHEYVQYAVAAGEDYSGKVMPQAPQHQWNAQVGWKFLPQSRLALGVLQQGSYWMNNLNSVRYSGHTLWNMSATHRLSAGWELWGQVRNLTDARYADSASSAYKAGVYTPNTQNTYAPGAPRSVMVGLTKSFGQP